MSPDLNQFKEENYLNLETYRRNGVAVKTPVWFLLYENGIYVITKKKTGKVKRIKNNTSVRIIPCNFLGKGHGTWISGVARFANTEESNRALALRKKKYGIKAILSSLFTFGKGDLVTIVINPT